MARKAKRDLTIEQKLARGPIDLPFLVLVLMLTVIGLIMLFSASFPSALKEHNDPFFYARSQAAFAAAGFSPTARILIPSFVL